jgi:hypothetical protein
MACRQLAEAPRPRLNQKIVVWVQNLNIQLLVHTVAPSMASTVCHDIHVSLVFELQSKQINKFKPMV